MINGHTSYERLCHAVLEGTASEAELEQFRQQLRGSAAACKAYAEQTQIHALLTWQQGRAAVTEEVTSSSTCSGSMRSFTRMCSGLVEMKV